MELESYTGEIKMFAGAELPDNFEWCDGKVLNIGAYRTLYNIIGTKFGGDGKQTFAVPDLRTKVPMGMGIKDGLTPRTIGDTSEVSSYTVSIRSLPTHSHTLYGVSDIADTASPENALHGSFPVSRTSKKQYSTKGDINVFLEAASISPAGATVPRAVSVIQPYLAIGFAICLVGDESDKEKDK